MFKSLWKIGILLPRDVGGGRRSALLFSSILLALATHVLPADPPDIPTFRAVTIDQTLDFGVAVRIADVDGDGKKDIVAADRHRLMWYKNPTWEKSVIAEFPTPERVISLAAQSLEGRMAIAVGVIDESAFTTSVRVFIQPGTAFGKWESTSLRTTANPAALGWYRTDEWTLVVVHEGGTHSVEAVSYQIPADVHAEWKPQLSITKEIWGTPCLVNHDVSLKLQGGILIGDENGVRQFAPSQEWEEKKLSDRGFEPFRKETVSQLCLGHFGSDILLGAILPENGGHLLVSIASPVEYQRHWRDQVVAEKFPGARAIRCANFQTARFGRDQIVTGSATVKDAPGKQGIRLWTPLDETGAQWRETVIDGEISCEDLEIAPLGIIGCGGATHDLKIYFRNPAGGRK